MVVGSWLANGDKGLFNEDDPVVAGFDAGGWNALCRGDNGEDANTLYEAELRRAMGAEDGRKLAETADIGTSEPGVPGVVSS